MRRLVVVCVVVVVLSSGGRARADSHVGGYAEPSALGGILNVDERVTVAVIGLRATAGVRWNASHCAHWRFGGVGDLLVDAGRLGGTGAETSSGLELAVDGTVDWPVSASWRLGPRLALGYGLGGTSVHGWFGGVGLTARRGVLILGLDGEAVDGVGPITTRSIAVVSHVGLSGRFGVVAEIVSTVATAAAIGYLAAALQGTH